MILARPDTASFLPKDMPICAQEDHIPADPELMCDAASICSGSSDCEDDDDSVKSGSSSEAPSVDGEEEQSDDGEDVNSPGGHQSPKCLNDIIKSCSPIRSSLFLDGEEVLVFPPDGEFALPLPKHLANALKFKVSGFTPKVVRAALLRANFTLIKKGKRWIGSWGKHASNPTRFKAIAPWKKVNHFPMSFQIGRKDKLWRNYIRCQGTWGFQLFNFLPETYLLPTHLPSLMRIFHSQTHWIVKPPASARGHGIRVITHPKKLPKKRKVVVSRYITKPYLIGGRKFDIRLYVVVTSWEPLRVYLAEEGIVRFASQKYTTSVKSAGNRYIHLTNYSVSRHAKDKGSQPDTPETFLLSDPRFSATASKWSFTTLQDYFHATNVNVAPVIQEIHRVVVKTIIAGHASNSSGVKLYAQNPSTFYELFGFDILLDAQLKPWLMEVNISPSLKASCDMDWKIKSTMVTDLFNLVGFKVSDLKRVVEGDSFDAATVISSTGSSDSGRGPGRPQSSMLTRISTLPSQALTSQDILHLQESEDENARLGNFVRLVPHPHQSHAPYLPSTHATQLLQQWTELEPDAEARIKRLRSLLPGDSIRVLPKLARQKGHLQKTTRRSASSLSYIKSSTTTLRSTSSLSAYSLSSSPPSHSDSSRSSSASVLYSMTPTSRSSLSASSTSSFSLSSRSSSSSTKSRVSGLSVTPASSFSRTVLPTATTMSSMSHLHIHQSPIRLQPVPVRSLPLVGAEEAKIHNPFPSWKAGRGQSCLKFRKEKVQALNAVPQK
ncbi:tubulin-tyrosine ligase family-domain-containing protein [Phlyctochytrium arcticum]|nr:tubulin-tyrosine ligase family-domain-containing protein [Phlyctochytrium arcticum]